MKTKKIKEKEYNRNYEILRKERDLSFKTRRQTSQFFSVMGRKRNLSKYGKSIWKFLPYTQEEFNKHIESQFEDWMTWENRGKFDKNSWIDNDPLTWKWQVDHIIPQSTFDFKEFGDEEWLKCQDLSNLRPLSAKQNIHDGQTKIRHHKKIKK